MRNMQSYLLVPFVLCCVVCLALPEAADASECSACGYLARNCSDASDGVDVCDVTGGIQIDDVFCNDQECSCANGHECVSTVVGCSTIFQARTRRRCVGNATLSRRFTQCAVDQDLTSLSASNVAQDWIYFKQGHKCQSMDCLAIKMFHHSGLVQCGNLLAVWKTTDSAVATSTPLDSRSMDGDVVYHFIADGSRAKDMKAGTFLYSVPWSTKAGALLPTQAQSTATGSCYVLQTRNQPNSTCEGVYLQFDASVEFANSDEYVMSKLSWPVWLAVIGSVAAAIASVAVVSVGNLRDSKDFSPINATCPGTPLPVPGNGRMSTDLRQRAAPDAAQLEAGACTTAL
ncbi:unnamed protein product [Hyaloperonospora brassicae]|uniref:Transmembrane protein n=2 Tax=Hyaloperonospora brassicae TaxID=162125 RepID=A0AAV0TYY8_HYABA|nr:unnamed protein product [Hyaloperonospora brassicae]